MDSVSLSQCALIGSNDRACNGFTVVMACENYFRLGNRQVFPIILVDNSQIVIGSEKKDDNSSLYNDIFKVASYVSIILPLLAGIVVLVARKYYQIQDISSIIRAAGQSEARSEVIDDLNHIFHGLYLGNGSSFLDCTDFTDVVAMDENNLPNGSLRETENPLHFQHVITMCPLSALSDRSETLYGNNLSNGERRIREYFEKARVNWLYAGRSISDVSTNSNSTRGIAQDTEMARQKKWKVLVHDTTFWKSDLSKYEPFGNLVKDLEENQDKKSRVFDNPEIQAQQWFEPAFEILDKAVFGGEKTLVHCSEGKSRSAAILIAYLVNRFKVSAEQATRFLQSKRPIVKPGFIQELKAYEQLIFQSSR